MYAPLRMQVSQEVVLSEPILKAVFKDLPKCALAGRICYSKDSIEEIVATDDRVADREKRIEYLARLVGRGHFSIFEHSFTIFNKNEIAQYYFEKKERFNLGGMIRTLMPGLDKLIMTVAGNYYQGLPINGTTPSQMEIEAIGDILLRQLSYELNVLPRSRDYIAINLRHILEVALYTKFKGDKKQLADWFSETADRYSPTGAYSLITDKKELISSKGNLFLIGEGSQEGLTFVIEGCSRTLTHQLVRHRLFASYSQKSLRYTDVENLDNFVVPPLDYIEGDIEKVQGVFKEAYSTALLNYGTLRELGERKEDARFVIPSGVRTTIMATMLFDGLENFIEERTNPHAQWEIREVAEIVRDWVTTNSAREEK